MIVWYAYLNSDINSSFDRNPHQRVCLLVIGCGGAAMFRGERRGELQGPRDVVRDDISLTQLGGNFLRHI